MSIEVSDPNQEAPAVELFRRFELYRTEDVSGISGTGVVAQGCQFEDGSAVLHWLGDMPSTVVYTSIDDLLAVHGHEGRTTVDWVDGVEEFEDQVLEGGLFDAIRTALSDEARARMRQLERLSNQWVGEGVALASRQVVGQELEAVLHGPIGEDW